MDDRKKELDPYAEWLQIPTQQRPPDHYALLGLDAWEEDAKKIDTAAKKRAAYLHQLAAGPHRALRHRQQQRDLKTLTMDDCTNFRT